MSRAGTHVYSQLQLHPFTQYCSFFFLDGCHIFPLQVSPSKSQGFGEQRSQTIAVLSSPPRATTALRYGTSVVLMKDQINWKHSLNITKKQLKLKPKHLIWFSAQIRPQQVKISSCGKRWKMEYWLLQIGQWLLIKKKSWLVSSVIHFSKKSSC